MNEHIIKMWNSIVRPIDTVYHLGDVAFGSKKNLELAHRLNGHKKLVLGNHDTHASMQHFAEVGFEDIFGVFKLAGQFLVSHAPVHPDELEYRANYNIHGHTHSRLVLDKFKKPDPRYINVCVERCNYMPVPLDGILQYQKDILEGNK